MPDDFQDTAIATRSCQFICSLDRRSGAHHAPLAQANDLGRFAFDPMRILVVVSRPRMQAAGVKADCRERQIHSELVAIVVPITVAITVAVPMVMPAMAAVAPARIAVAVAWIGVTVAAI